MNFVEKAIQAGGSIHPLIIPADQTNGTALFNPSVYKDGDEILCNVRHCQYTIYHSEKGRFEHQWGPLTYMNPENDMTLTTTNFLMRLNPRTLEPDSVNKIDTSEFDVKPLWTFVGLEDVRVFKWDNRLFYCGVRRDTTAHGEGRMELSEIVDNKEVFRWRIPAPPPNNSYCEKNWMPVVDLPWHFVKWSNPTEVVKIAPEAGTCEQVHLGTYIPQPQDYRGGSQVIPFGKYRIALVHLVHLYKSPAGRKNGRYRHAFVVWDRDWNVVKYTQSFSFLGAEIEFCAGMTAHENDFLISFGFQDNAAFLLKTPSSIIEEYIYAN